MTFRVYFGWRRHFARVGFGRQRQAEAAYCTGQLAAKAADPEAVARRLDPDSGFDPHTPERWY